MSEKDRGHPVLALVPNKRMSEEKKELIPFRVSFKEGDVIFSMGEPGTTLFIVEDGEVQITLPHPHPKKGIQVELVTIGEKGGIVGDEILFGYPTRPTTCLARTNCHLLQFTREQFLGVYLTKGERAESILRAMLQRTYQIHHRYLDKLVQIVDLEERIAELEATARLDAGWSTETTVAKTALEQARTEIAGLRGELAQRVLLASGEDDIKAWRKTFAKQQAKLDDEERQARELAKRLRDSEREQQMLADALTHSEQRRQEAVDSADAAVKTALEQIETLQGENTALLQENARLLAELDTLRRKDGLKGILEDYVLLDRPKRG